MLSNRISSFYIIVIICEEEFAHISNEMNRSMVFDVVVNILGGAGEVFLVAANARRGFVTTRNVLAIETR